MHTVDAARITQEILISEEDLRRRIGELGKAISADYTGRDLLLVAILKGSVIFLADLMRVLTVPVYRSMWVVEEPRMTPNSAGMAMASRTHLTRRRRLRSPDSPAATIPTTASRRTSSVNLNNIGQSSPVVPCGTGIYTLVLCFTHFASRESASCSAGTLRNRRGGWARG